MSLRLPRVSKAGYDLAGDRAHILILHGFTGSPYDLRPLGDYLNRRGFHVLAPLLLGHGTKPSDLFGIQAQDWLDQAATALQSFKKDRPIVLAGLSMGALLAILLASHSNIKALLLFSPALKLNRLAELAVASAQGGWLDKNSSLKKLSGGSDVADPLAKKRTPAYHEMPIMGLLEFEKLQLLAQEKLSAIPCPIFMAFGKKDSAIDVARSHQMILEASLQPILGKIYESSKHLVTLDYDREELCSDVYYFLTNRLGI